MAQLSEKEQATNTFINVIKSHLMLETLMERQAELLAALNKTTPEAELAKSREILQAKHNKTADHIRDKLKS